MSKYSDLTVIIPSLDERGNISMIIRELTRRYAGVHVIISDDGSKDGTKAEAEKAIKRTGNSVVFLDRGRERHHGLTVSVIDAAMHVRTSRIIVMDADLQHPIEKVKDIHAALADNDLAIGIRTSVKEWGMHRRILSKGINTISYAVFKLRGKPTCSDMMSGFFGIRTSLFQKVIRENRRGFVYDGYKVLLDTLRMLGKGVAIKEVGYSTFRDRKHGRSKLKTRHIIRVLNSTFR